MTTLSQVHCLLPVLTAWLFLSACSNEMLYDVTQRERWWQCEEMPIPQQEACRADYGKSYEEYRRELEELDRERPGSPRP